MSLPCTWSSLILMEEEEKQHKIHKEEEGGREKGTDGVHTARCSVQGRHTKRYLT